MHNTSMDVISVLEESKKCLQGILESKHINEVTLERTKRLLVEIEFMLGYNKGE